MSWEDDSLVVYIAVDYFLEDKTFSIDSNVADSEQSRFLREFLDSQNRSEEDPNPLNEHAHYRIEIQHDTSTGAYRSRDNAGNKDFRDGVLYTVLDELSLLEKASESERGDEESVINDANVDEEPVINNEQANEIPVALEQDLASKSVEETEINFDEHEVSMQSEQDLASIEPVESVDMQKSDEVDQEFLLAMEEEVALIEDAQEPKLDVVELAFSRSGATHVLREGVVSGDQDIVLCVEAEQVSDVLRSISVVDKDGGDIAGLCYEVSEKDGGSPSDLALSVGSAGMIGLLRQMTGAIVRFVYGQAVVRGAILGVNRVKRMIDGVTYELDRISLSTQSGISQFEIDAISSIVFEDSALQKDIEHFVENLSERRVLGGKKIVIQARGEGERTVQAKHVVLSKPWKVTHRLVCREDKALLESYAMLSNPLPEDLKDVKVSLTLESSEYDLKYPVSMKRGGAVVAPVGDREVEIEHVLFYDDLSGKCCPMKAVQVHNADGNAVEPGVVAVFSEKAYLGESSFPKVGKGDIGLIPYQDEPLVEVSKQSSFVRDLEMTKMSLKNGSAVLHWLSQKVTPYSVDNSGGEALHLFFDVPKDPMYDQVNEDLFYSESSQAYRLFFDVAAGEDKQVDVAYSGIRSKTLSLKDLDDQSLEDWVEAGCLNEQVLQEISDALDLRMQWSEARKEVDALCAEIERDKQVLREQQELLSAIRGSKSSNALQERLLADTESRYFDIPVKEKRLAELRDNIDELKGAFDAEIGAIDYEWSSDDEEDATSSSENS